MLKVLPGRFSGPQCGEEAGEEGEEDGGKQGDDSRKRREPKEEALHCKGDERETG